MRWAGIVARKEQRRNEFRFLLEKLRERDHLQELDVDEEIILK
jgi:hypothetical protein